MAITRVSTDAAGAQAVGGLSEAPAFSPDGTRIAFSSRAANLVAGDTNDLPDVFLKVLATGAITRVSTDASGAQATGGGVSMVDLINPVFSPDGTRIAFASRATNLVPGDTNSVSDIFVKHLGTAAITRVSTDATGSQAVSTSTSPVFSPDGTRIAFASIAGNLVPGDTNGRFDIFVKTLASGEITRVSTDASGGQATIPDVFGGSFDPVFSPDGTRVGFTSGATNLVPGDTNSVDDLFVKNLATGAITRVSTDASGAQGDRASSDLVFSPDGARIAFSSDARNLVPGDTNDTFDIFVKNLGTGAIARVSTDASGGQATTSNSGVPSSFDPVFSPDGTRIAFVSSATNLAPGDTNFAADVFVKDLGTGLISRVSTDAAGGQGSLSSSGRLSFSPDGTRLAFVSAATNLVPGDTNSQTDVFVTDQVIPCFASGTRIGTPAGEAEVERLATGDIVLTASGEARAVRWLGHRRVECARHPQPATVWPVRVRAGAFGPSLPVRDLWLSPDHSVAVTCIDEVLVPIKCLLNGTTIAQVEVASVTYWHVELESHDVLLAEGLPAESYLDTGNRSSFAGGVDPTALYPTFAGHEAAGFCRSVHLDGPVVKAVRARLLARAEATGSRRPVEVAKAEAA